MAKIRTIKPEFWDSETMAHMPFGCRLLFIGLWNFADDIGLIKASDKYIKSKIFPYDDSLRLSEINTWLKLLVKHRLIVPFEHRRESYYVIRCFSEHQRPDERYARYLLSPTPKNEDGSNNITGRLIIEKFLLGLAHVDTTLTHGDNNVVTSLSSVGGSVGGIESGGDIGASVLPEESPTTPPPIDDVPRKGKKAVPPTLEEVISYFKENGYKETAGRKAYDYYALADWHDSMGNKVRNWKQKMHMVWFKEENVELKPQIAYTPTENDRF